MRSVGPLEIAIAATDLAEVIGTIIALKLLFGLPYLGGLAIAARDTFLLLALQRRGVRLLEVLTLTLIGVIGVSFVVEIVLAAAGLGGGRARLRAGPGPTTDRGSLYVAIGMLGATVMPHNLYLHSALVQTRAFRADRRTASARRCKYNLFDPGVALNGAFLVNAAILILAAALFAGRGRDARSMRTVCSNVAGVAIAGDDSVRSGAAGVGAKLDDDRNAGRAGGDGRISQLPGAAVGATIVHTLARLAAGIAGGCSGRRGRGDAFRPRDGSGRSEACCNCSILSQVILSLQLPFAIIPLIHFTSDRRGMGDFATRGLWKVLAWACAIIVVVLNAILVVQSISKWSEEAAGEGRNPLPLYLGVGGVR